MCRSPFHTDTCTSNQGSTKSERPLLAVSSIDRRNTVSYLLEMECANETPNPHLL